jgi:hypothetical protein
MRQPLTGVELGTVVEALAGKTLPAFQATRPQKRHESQEILE